MPRSSFLIDFRDCGHDAVIELSSGQQLIGGKHLIANKRGQEGKGVNQTRVE